MKFLASKLLHPNQKCLHHLQTVKQLCLCFWHSGSQVWLFHRPAGRFGNITFNFSKHPSLHLSLSLSLSFLSLLVFFILLLAPSIRWDSGNLRRSSHNTPHRALPERQRHPASQRPCRPWKLPTYLHLNLLEVTNSVSESSVSRLLAPQTITDGYLHTNSVGCRIFTWLFGIFGTCRAFRLMFGTCFARHPTVWGPQTETGLAARLSLTSKAVQNLEMPRPKVIHKDSAMKDPRNACNSLHMGRHVLVIAPSCWTLYVAKLQAVQG